MADVDCELGQSVQAQLHPYFKWDVQRFSLVSERLFYGHCNTELICIETYVG